MNVRRPAGRVKPSARMRLRRLERTRVAGEEKRAKREPVELRAARMTVVAALVAAFIGALGASIPALIVTSSQIRAADEQQTSNFVRTQRQEVYAKFIATYTQLQPIVEQDFLFVIVTAEPGDPPLPTQLPPGLEDLQREMTDAIAVIRVIGSRRSIDLAERIEQHLKDYRKESDNLGYFDTPNLRPSTRAIVTDEFLNDKKREALQRRYELEKSLKADRIEFEQTVRSELGAAYD